jgi:hypothetical protein
MWLQIGRCGGYKARGLQEQRDGGWRITTWPEGKDAPQNNYWVNEGVFFNPRSDMPPNHTEWQKASFGAPEDSIDESEKNAVLELIQKWDAQMGSPPWTIARRPGELLRTGSENDPSQYLTMQKRKNPAKRARTTLSSVKREMLEPRLTESVRNTMGSEPAPVIDKPFAGSRKVPALVMPTSQRGW